MIEGRASQKPKDNRHRQPGYQGKTHIFDFVVFKNYDGSHTGKAIPREVYKKLFSQNVQISDNNGII
jgi:hypothetical protein